VVPDAILRGQFVGEYGECRNANADEHIRAQASGFVAKRAINYWIGQNPLARSCKP
jgi:hypothetical protein